MLKILYVERVYRPENREELRHQAVDLERMDTICRILSGGDKPFEVIRAQNYFSRIPEILSRDTYNGLLTNFPSGHRFGDSKDRLENYRILYGASARMLTEIRKEYPILPIIVHTGASSGEKEDPSTRPMTTIIDEAIGTEYGRIVFKSLPENDGRKIKSYLDELLQ